MNTYTNDEKKGSCRDVSKVHISAAGAPRARFVRSGVSRPVDLVAPDDGVCTIEDKIYIY